MGDYIYIGGAAAHPGLFRCTKCNSQPVNGQCTNHRMYNGPLVCGIYVLIK